MQEAGIHAGACGCDRAARSMALLTGAKGEIDEKFLMRVLRDHGGAADWNPGRDRTMKSICVHSDGSLVPSQTTNSLVSVLADQVQTHWVTGSSAPCTSIFKPIFFPGAWAPSEPAIGKIYDPRTLWWQHEELHRLVLLDYPKRMPAYAVQRDELEAKFIAGAREAGDFARGNMQGSEDPIPRLVEYSKNVFRDAMQAETKWIQDVRAIPAEQKFEAVYRMHWNKTNKMDEMPKLTP
jgi:secernin